MKKNIKKIISLICLILLLIVMLCIFRHEVYNFALGLYHSFYRTVIEEERYKLLLNGLVSTIIISIFSILIGTFLGIAIYYIRTCNIKFINKLFKLFVKFIQGVPITVMLLTFYYVIFGKVNIEPLIVAIITFSLYFSAYASEIFRGAMESINPSQIQSAYALSFSKYQVFKYIIFPQILVYIIPVYKNEVVSLIKLTSIAGYISIMDLTKASDIIRNRTYEAFFPLIIVALIYFVICYLIGMSLDLLYKSVNPRKYLRGNK